MASACDRFEPVTRARPAALLGPEVIRVAERRDVQGAGCWHLATAVRLLDELGPLHASTLDLRQQEVAPVLGFAP